MNKVSYLCIMGLQKSKIRKPLWVSCAIGACFGALLVAVTIAAPSVESALGLVLPSVCVALLLRGEANADENSGAVVDTAISLARVPELLDAYKRMGNALLRINWRNDPIFFGVASEQLEKTTSRIEQISQGVILFETTETWRIVYEMLLRSRGLHLYRSVSWIATDRYWQDEPGRQSLRLNLELHAAGQLRVERIVILGPEVWPSNEPLPVSQIRQWIHEQHIAGIQIKLVRQSELAGESDLVSDIGVYGMRAVGTQTLDDQSRTVKFRLDFNMDSIEQAEERWRRLEVYAMAYGDLLDHFTLDE